MTATRPFDVFISYSTADIDYARLVMRAVTNLGFRVFLADKTLNAGEHLSVLAERIRRAKLVVLLWSEDASKSEWVRDEVGAAWGAHVPVIPVLLSKDLMLPPSLRATGVKYQDAVARDAASVLNVQSAVIAWWHSVLAAHASQQAALEEQRRAQQAETNKTVLGVLATGAVLWAMSKGS